MAMSGNPLGSGTPWENFFVDDMAQAVVFALENTLPDYLYNVQEKIWPSNNWNHPKITGHQGEIIWDATKPDGTPRKLMDISKCMHWDGTTN
jgi:GDP-L-fucose synthase